jgi:hypothetical protein
VNGPPRLFISYAREDREVVKPLAKGLEQAGYDVWWDKELSAGAAFRDSIEEQLTSSDVIVVVWSKRAKASRWVLDEAERGVNRGVLLPLRIDGATLPLGFGGFHVLDFSAWDGSYTSDSWRTFLAEINRVAVVPTPLRPRPAIRVAPQALTLVVAWGTVIGSLLWAFYAREARTSVFGYPIIDAIVAGCIGSAMVVLWSAIEVHRAGFESLVLIFRRSVWWFFISAMCALLMLVVAIAGGALAETAPRKAIGQLAKIFFIASFIAAMLLAVVNLVWWTVKKALATVSGFRQFFS